MDITRMVIAVAFVWSAVVQADTIRAVAGGGKWSEPVTWKDAAVPTEDDDVVINGTVVLNVSAACRSLTVAENAVLRNDSVATKQVILTVGGPIVNNGAIRHVADSAELWIELRGDCVNNGVWAPSRTFFALRDTQHIAQSPESEFGGTLFLTDAAGRSDTFPLIAKTDLTIHGGEFDCHRRTAADTIQGTVDMAGNQLFFIGGTAVSGAALRNTSMVTFYDSSTIRDCTFEDNVMVSGICTVLDSNVCFRKDLMISGGTLQSGPGLDPIIVRVYGGVVNNGLLSSNPDGSELWLELHGDIYNAGDWTPARTYIPQKKRQTISQIAQSKFEGFFFLTAISGATASDTFPLVASSNLLFHGKELQCFKDTLGPPRPGKLDMAGFNITLSGGAYFEGAVVSRTNRVTCLDSAMIGETTFLHTVQACGNFKAAMQGVYFNDTLIVIDTLENGAGGCCIANGMLFARKGIINNGVIRNNPHLYDLWCQISGPVVNRGTWINAENILTDTVPQEVRLEKGCTIAAAFSFDGMWPEGPYSWEKDGTVLEGDTLRLLRLDSLVAASAGVYRCGRGNAWSRAITVIWDSTVRVVHPVAEKKRADAPWCAVLGKRPGIRIQTSGAESYAIRIFDMRGRCIVSQNGSAPGAGSHFIPLSLQELGTGTYTVVVRTRRQESVMRIAIAR